MAVPCAPASLRGRRHPTCIAGGMLIEAKIWFRRCAREALEELSPSERARKSARVREAVVSTRIWGEAGTLLGYLPFGGEVDIEPLLETARTRGRAVYVPRIHGRDLEFHAIGDTPLDREVHPYGMREPPAELETFEARAGLGPVLVLAPGLAFDRLGGRLGRGRGYYDRWLCRLRATDGVAAVIAGIGYAEQLHGEIPCGPGDERMDAVITDREIVWIRGRP